MNQRQLQQQAFDLSGQNLIVGNVDQCPLPPEILAFTTADSEYVVETFESGLTAQVFHIRVGGRDYTLKKNAHRRKCKTLMVSTPF